MSESFNAGDASMLFTADDSQFQKTADKVEQSMKKVAGQARDSGKEIEGFVVNVRQFTILYQLADGLKAMGDASKKMATDMRLGKAEAGDLFEKVAEGIPIIGKFVEAGRAIREAITGEQAYTEVLKQQIEQQEKRIELVHSYTDAMKQLRRTAEDIEKNLNAPKGLGTDLFGIFTGASRKNEDLPKQIKARFAQEFKDIEDARKPLIQKLAELQKQNHPTVVLGNEGSPTRVFPVSADVLSGIADTQGQIAKLDTQSAKLRSAISNVEALTRQKINADAFTSGMNAIADSLIHSSNEFGAWLRNVVGKTPQIHEVSKNAIDGAVTEFDRLRLKTIQLREDFSHGLISESLFKETDLKLKIDTAAAIINSLWSKIKPPASVALHFLVYPA